MSNIEALKEQARRHEQKEEWQKACDLYMRAIERLDEEEQPDIGLYNRVGDILIRLGTYEKAVEHFERATDLYLEAELPNNAIAVCKKVIRHLPNRSETFLRMGKIRASQGFLVDARDNFLMYAERMQAAGEIEEALRALVEFAELAPEDTEIRMAVATQLQQHDRGEEALEQLAAGYRVLKSRGDDGAEAFEEKILEIDPEADLEALGAAAPGHDAFAFESTALGEMGGGDSDFEAEFGDIMLPTGGTDEPAAPTPRDPPAAQEADEGIGDFADIAFGGGEEEEHAAATPEAAGESSLDEMDALDFGKVEPGPFVGGVDDGDDEEEGGDLPLMSFDDDEEGEEEGEPIPYLTDFVDEALEDSEADDEEEVGEPLPFLSMEDEVEEEPAAPVESSLDLSDTLEEAQEEAVAETRSDPRAEWEALRERCREAPGEVESPQQLVELAFKLGDQEALVESYLILANALRESGSEGRAEAVLQQVLSLDPDNAEARAALGEGGKGSAAPAREVAAADDYVDLGSLIFDEDDGEKSTRFRVAYEEPSGDEQADFAKMLNQFKAKVAENFDVSDVKAHHDLGTAYKEMGLLDEAVEKFQEALRASPTHLATYELLGQTFMDKGENAAAVRVLERALRVSSDVEDEFIGIYYYLARAHEEMGNRDKAVEFYDQVFALDINFMDVTERLRNLR